MGVFESKFIFDRQGIGAWIENEKVSLEPISFHVEKELVLVIEDEFPFHHRLGRARF